MPFPIDVERYDFYLQMDAPGGIVVAGVFRRTEDRLHFRVLHSQAPDMAREPVVESVAARQLEDMVLRKWNGNVGVDLARSAHRAFAEVPNSEIGGEAKYLPPPDRFKTGNRSE